MFLTCSGAVLYPMMTPFLVARCQVVRRVHAENAWNPLPIHTAFRLLDNYIQISYLAEGQGEMNATLKN